MHITSDSDPTGSDLSIQLVFPHGIRGLDMGNSGPWFCGPIISTKTKVPCFYSTMLSMLLFHPHSLRIAARDPAFTLTFNSGKERKRPKRQCW